jgi:uncharacterized protein (DUF1501 family)
MKTPIYQNRRSFLRTTSYGGFASSAAASIIANLVNVSRVSAAYDFQDYKALICLFKFGGNDSFNMLVPLNVATNTSDTSPHAEYATRRGNNALAANTLLPLNYNTANGSYASIGTRLNNWNFGLHPSMPNLRTLYNTDRDAAFMANVGSLSVPIANITELPTKEQPLGLYSHSDQIAAWQTIQPQLRANTGWASRLAERLYADTNGTTRQPVNNWTFFNISLAGSDPTLMGGGSNVSPYRISSGGPTTPDFLKASTPEASAAFNLLLQSTQSYPNRLDQTLRSTQSRSVSALDTFNQIVNDPSTATARAAILDAIPDTLANANSVAKQLRTVANLMVGRNTLTAKRQIFFVGLGGWDQHDNLLEDHAENLKMIDDAIGPFANALRDSNVGLWNSTTLFTCSDFGRTLTSNGDGTDHGWGGNTFVIGGPVRGGMIYGRYPRLAATVNSAPNTLDTGRGRFIPTDPVDRYLDDMLTWFGMAPEDIGSVAGGTNVILPNRLNFPTGVWNIVA